MEIDVSSSWAPGGEHRTGPVKVSFADPKVAVVVPCYRETEHVLKVLAEIPQIVNKIYCVDDHCPDQTGALVVDRCTDPRVRVLFNDTNLGVGGATMRGYRRALADGAQIVIKLDGDGQMVPGEIPDLIAPIVRGSADYVKCNRFMVAGKTGNMPRSRLFGNVVLSMLSRISTGYWHIFDPANGFTAVHAGALSSLDLGRISNDYFFESDMLFHLARAGAVVADVPQQAHYGDEVSHLKPVQVIPAFLKRHARNFISRVVWHHPIRERRFLSMAWVLGPMMLLAGLAVGIADLFWGVHVLENGPLWWAASSPGTPVILGMLMIGLAILSDVRHRPQVPIHLRRVG